MSTGFGHQTYVGIRPEVTYGTPLTANQFFEINSESIKGGNPIESMPTLRFRSKKRRIAKVKNVAGGFVMPLHWNGCETLLKHAFGSVGTTGTNPYTHTFSLAAQPVGLTVHVNRDTANVGAGSAFVYHGCRVSKLTLTQDIDNHLLGNFEFIGEDFGNEAAIGAPTFPTWDPIEFYDATTTTINSVACELENFELVVDQNIAPRPKLGSRLTRSPLPVGGRTVSGKTTLEFDSLDEYTLYRDQTAGQSAKPLVIGWVSSAKTLTLTLPNVFYSGGDPVVGDEGRIMLNLEFEADMNSTDGDEAALVLVNTTSSVA